MIKQIGFLGLGVMGEPMCRNLATKSKAKVVVYDLAKEPLERLSKHGVVPVTTAKEVIEGSDFVMLCLPSGEIVDQVINGPSGLLSFLKPGQVIVDLSTTSVRTTRKLAKDLKSIGCEFVDAPIARTRAAAEAGTLSIMVGADRALFEQVKPILATFAEEITLCGPTGSGQVLKILNNMLLFESVAALSQAKRMGEIAGVDPTVLFSTLTKGSADSFALRNHGMKAILPNEFPERAFSVKYARKDLRYALQLASDAGLEAQNIKAIDDLFSKAIDAGWGDQYWPVISRTFSETLPETAA